MLTTASKADDVSQVSRKVIRREADVFVAPTDHASVILERGNVRAGSRNGYHITQVGWNRVTAQSRSPLNHRAVAPQGDARTGASRDGDDVRDVLRHVKCAVGITPANHNAIRAQA